MRQRGEIKTLKDIHQICHVQRTGATFDVERAQGRLRDLDRQQEAEARVLHASNDAWRRAISGTSFQLMASASWAAEILSNQKAVEETGAKKRQAEAEHLRLCEIRTGLTARCDAIADLTRTARRLDQRRREEAALEEQSRRALSGWRSV
jgi:hypothetical protein